MMHIQTKGLSTAPLNHTNKATAKTEKTATQKPDAKVSLSPQGIALSQQVKKKPEEKPYQFKNPDDYLNRIINGKYDSNLVQMSLRGGSGDTAIYFTDLDRERLKEAYIYADKNGLDIDAVSMTAFELSQVRSQEAMERNGTVFFPPASAEELRIEKLRKEAEENGDPLSVKEYTWEDYYNSPEYIKRRDEFLEMIKPNPFLQQFIDEVIKVL